MTGYVAYMVRYPVKGSNMLALTSGAHITRRAAIKAFSKRLPKGWTWKKAYRLGCRVVLVRTTELKAVH